MNATKRVQNLNEAQKAYSEAKKEAQELLKSISRALIDTPAACNGNWGLVGDMNALISDLKDINDRMNGSGEYAK